MPVTSYRPAREPLVTQFTATLRRAERMSTIAAVGAALAVGGLGIRFGVHPAIVALSVLVVLLAVVSVSPILIEDGPVGDLIALSAVHEGHQTSEFRAAGGGRSIPKWPQAIDGWLRTMPDTDALRPFRVILLVRRGRLDEASVAASQLVVATPEAAFQRRLLDAMLGDVRGEDGPLEPVIDALDQLDDPASRRCAAYALHMEEARRLARAGLPWDGAARAAVRDEGSIRPARLAWVVARLRLLGPIVVAFWGVVVLIVAFAARAI
jgi:hypothetical protein